MQLSFVLPNKQACEPITKLTCHCSISGALCKRAFTTPEEACASNHIQAQGRNVGSDNGGCRVGQRHLAPTKPAATRGTTALYAMTRTIDPSEYAYAW